MISPPTSGIPDFFFWLPHYHLSYCHTQYAFNLTDMLPLPPLYRHKEVWRVGRKQIKRYIRIFTCTTTCLWIQKSINSQSNVANLFKIRYTLTFKGKLKKCNQKEMKGYIGRINKQAKSQGSPSNFLSMDLCSISIYKKRGTYVPRYAILMNCKELQRSLYFWVIVFWDSKVHRLRKFEDASTPIEDFKHINLI